MIHSFLPAPLPTGKVQDDLWVIRDGFVNCFVLGSPGGLICVDAGWRPGRIRSGFQALGLDPDAVASVFLTHGHWDHAWGARAFPAARPLPAAQFGLRGIPCPGHTSDSLAYLSAAGDLFTGDTLRLRAGLARPNWAGLNRDNRQLRASLASLAQVPAAGGLFTAHTGSAASAREALRPWLPPEGS